MKQRWMAAAAVLFLLVGLFVGGAQPVAVGLVSEPWDKLVHAAAFMVLTLALLLAAGAQWQWRRGVCAPRMLAQRRALWSAVLLALLVAAADELHQAWWLPGRQAGWDDWLADVLGVALAAAWAAWGLRGTGEGGRAP